jgi:DNA topoisomerase-1
MDAAPAPAEPGIPDPRDAADSAGLSYVTDERPGILRRRAGKGFAYQLPTGGPVRDAATLKRIRSLAVPPAWRQVWICPQAEGHIQATGRDERGRKPYRYHPRWREVRDATKYHRLLEFARTLPAIRARVAEDMARPGLPREKVLATMVHLLETTLIRVGNDEYARENDSHGLTTLRSDHVEGAALRFEFRGKGGRPWRLSLRDRRVARIVRALQDLPGQELFQYRDAEGVPRAVGSADVNAYLRGIAGPEVTAKDFRTWAGTVPAALALRGCERFDSQAAAKRNLRAAIERVAARLGNTSTICRQCYVHPEVLDGYLDGAFAAQAGEAAEAEPREALPALRPEEAAVLAFLQARLAKRRAAAAGSAATAPRAPRRPARAGPRRRASIAAPRPRAAHAAAAGSAPAPP